MSYLGHSLGGVLPLCRGAVDVFYTPSRLGNIEKGDRELINYKKKDLVLIDNKKELVLMNNREALDVLSSPVVCGVEYTQCISTKE